MYKYLASFLMLIILTAFGCKHSVAFKEVQSPGKFTMQLPVYMHATTDLFPENKASVQYSSDSAQVYLVVYDTGREFLADKTLKSYYDSIVANPTLADAVIKPAKVIMVGKDSAMVTEMTGKQGEVALYYRIAVITDEQRVFYLLLWCPQSKLEELRPDIEKILNSFTDMHGDVKM